MLSPRDTELPSKPTRANYKHFIKSAAGEMDRIKNSTDPQELAMLFSDLADRSPSTLPVFAQNMYVPDDLLKSIPAKNPANRKLKSLVMQTLRKKEMSEKKLREVEGLEPVDRKTLDPRVLKGVGDVLIQVEGPREKLQRLVERYEAIKNEEITDEEKSNIGEVASADKRSNQIRIYFNATREQWEKISNAYPGVAHRNTGRQTGVLGFNPEYSYYISSNDLAWKLIENGLSLGKNQL